MFCELCARHFHAGLLRVLTSNSYKPLLPEVKALVISSG